MGTCALLAVFLLAPQAGPPGRGTWEPYAPLTDEFDGPALDESKWHPRNPEWRGRPPALFNPKNVSVRGGMLHLEARKETLPDAPRGYHTFTTAAVKSRTKVRYGYFEIRARAMDSHASSAFWFYDPTPEIWSEIDVFEIGARPQPHKYYRNTHLFHTLVETVHWHKSRIWEAPYDLSKEFHLYGLEWDRDEIRFTVDGRVVRAVEFSFPGRGGPSETVCRLKAEGGGMLAVRASGGAERPGRVRLELLDDAFFASQKDSEIRRDVKVRDVSGKTLVFSIAWSKTEPWKREGRSPAGEACGKAVPPVGGYHAVGIDVVPPSRRPRGTGEVFEFRAEEGTPVRVTVTH